MTQTAQLKSLFDQIANSSGELLQCLNDERQALSSKQYESLISLAEHKQNLVNTLDTLNKQRDQLSGQQDFDALLLALDQSRQLNQRWQSIKQTIRQCQQQNEVNGRILQRRNLLARETMAILTGRGTETQATYGADGLQQGPGSTLTNTEA